jgi:NTP pyrophosphatase (non-canonical NTP hydrolase)
MSDPDFNNLPLSQIASIIVRQLEITFPDENTLDTHNRQVLCLAEEIGEFIQAYRRYSGQARGHGDFDTMCAELADIVIVSHVTARVLGINLDDAIVKKLNRIFERGWHHDKPFEETVPLGDSPNA